MHLILLSDIKWTAAVLVIGCFLVQVCGSSVNTIIVLDFTAARNGGLQKSMQFYRHVARQWLRSKNEI